ncbi:MAG TPA: electron transfer flavoprotein subunit alpha/FixB family protein [Burkholderiaceae bacterium]|nr:electron transfer flavoprotein subunit alpha/FixB family protein [Burkholderiaceae bacterium]
MTRRSVRRPRRAAGAMRRDPRRERESVAEAAVPRDGEAATERDGQPARSSLTEIAIEHPDSIVIAVPDLDRGRLTALDRDLIGAARVLADAQRGAVLLVVPTDCTDDLGGAGADRVVRYAPPCAGDYLPAVLAPALVELAQRHNARHLLFGEGPAGGADLGRRVAARLGVWPAAHVAALGATEAACRIDAGRHEVVRAPPRVLLVEAGSAEPVRRARYQARPAPELELGREAGVIDLGAVKVDRSAVPLIEAELIVSAGAGVSDWAAFHRLAAELGAAEGASRVVCDLGHLPRDRQIGASGVVVEPRAYLAFGISGAPQHLQGIAQCERVVAVNSDPHAPMLQRADLAIVADVQQVMPALTNLIEQEKRRA